MGFIVKTKIPKNLLQKSKPTITEISKLADELHSKIVTRTLLGFGVVDRTEADRQVRLKPLNDFYKGFRKKYKNKLSQLTSTGRSNATFSGQLLSSVYSKATKSDEISLGVTDKRTAVFSKKEVNDEKSYPYKKFMGFGKVITNTKVLEYYEKMGRMFLGITRSEKTFLLRELKKIIIKRSNS